MAKRGCQDRRPDAVLAAVAAQPAQQRDAALLDAVAELGEQRRQHGQRAEHCDADDQHRRDPEAEVGVVAGEEEPGHGDHHRHARDQHGAAGGCGGGFERRARPLAGGPFFPLSFEVEERVVDADCESDEQDDGADVSVHRHELAW